MAQAYKPYVDYILAGGVAETAYIISHQGAICGTNLPINQFPSYNFQIEDENDPKVLHNMVVDERVNLIEALSNKGVAKGKAGIRIYNQKYYPVRYDEENKSLYLKKEGGGGCIVQTNQFYIIGTFNAQAKMSNGVPQNPGELNKRVEALAKDLISKKY